MEGLQRCPSSVKIMSGNTSNEWNKMNYTEEIRKTKNFVLAHETINSKINQIQRKKYLKYEVYRKSKQ